MIGGVTRHMLPHLSGFPYLHVNFGVLDKINLYLHEQNTL